jgi:hypothetical protein
MLSLNFFSYIDNTNLHYNRCNRKSDAYPFVVNCAGVTATADEYRTTNLSGRDDWYLLYVISGALRVKTDGGDDDTKAKARAKIDAIRDRIVGEINVEQAFADAARENSDCPSGKEGGDLGWFGPGQMVPEFDKAAFEMKVDEISGVVETQFGFHILRKTGEKPGCTKEFAEIKDALKENLARNAKNAAFGRFMGELRADAQIEFRDE